MLDQIEELTRRIRTLEIADDRETADVIGRLTKIISDLTAYKRDLMSELAGPVTGAVYRVTESNQAKRTYNTAGLLAAFGRNGVGVAELARADVLRVSWQWTKLKTALARENITLSIAPHEIEDTGEIDGPLVGEVWTTRQSVESA